MQDFRTGRDIAPDSRSFDPMTVDEETVYSSALVHYDEFIDRATFKRMKDCAPEEAKLKQVTWQDANKKQKTGIVQRRPDLSELLVRKCERRIIVRTPLMTPDDHIFKRQAELRARSRLAELENAFGLELGDKYKLTKHAIPSYTQAEIDDAVSKFQRANHGPSSAGASGACGSGLEGLDGMIGIDTPIAPARRRRSSPGPEVSALALRDGTPEAVSIDPANACTPGTMDDVDEADEAPGQHVGNGSSRAAATLSMESTVQIEELKDDGGTGEILDINVNENYDKFRVKPPGYWLQQVTIDKGWKRLNLEKQLKFADACVERNCAGVHSVEVVNIKLII